MPRRLVVRERLAGLGVGNHPPLKSMHQRPSPTVRTLTSDAGARYRRTQTCRTPRKSNLRRSNELLGSISHLRGRGALDMRTDELRAHVLGR